MSKQSFCLNGLVLNYFGYDGEVREEIFNNYQFITTLDVNFSRITDQLLKSNNSINEKQLLATIDLSDLSKDYSSEIGNFLTKGEVYIGIIPTHEFEEGNNVNTKNYYSALIYKNGQKIPEYVRLCENIMIDRLLFKDLNIYASKERIGAFYNMFYDLYNYFISPMEQIIDKGDKVYYQAYAASNFLNFNEIPIDSISSLKDYNTFIKVSSIREILNQRKKLTNINDFVLYGGIRYDIPIDEMKKNKVAKQIEIENYIVSRDVSDRGKLNYLAASLNEVEQVSKLCKKNGYKVNLYVGEKASEESFKALSGHSPTILHIATHGFNLVDENRQKNQYINTIVAEKSEKQSALLYTGLLLAGASNVWSKNEIIPEGVEDGILTSFEISQLDLSNTELVVLSACQTGLGNSEMVDGVYGLQRAFKLAGVKSIMMSLWNVPDDATSLLMEYFYKELISGVERHEALRKAQDEVKKLFWEPYYWAGFIILD